MNRIANTRRQSRGFTLVELCTSVGICAALVGQAVPAMGKLRQEQKLRVSAEALASDLRLARSEAARLGDSVYFRISGRGANACYVMYIGRRDDCDCAGGRPVCLRAGSQIIKAEWLPTGQSLRLSSNAETLQFQHRQGLVTQTGSIDLGLSGGQTIRQVVAITGRVRSCYVGTQKVGGMPRCA
ncbi:Tfp pilus assembly protein FimT [Pelomonas saccharophila]|uniref:Type II secretion system protein H n=1 Tax=Roseateles saccharophilus TaxID=304 RepID=A0ABU1YH15_ROSSA|nr:GspH/FimT family pseudopilin [Roseateles saccharophilus]MDR7267471.1 Tfp pilus assembly protein FimT [Roseateles saccharophilus]